jgi:hypothetical protein
VAKGHPLYKVAEGHRFSARFALGQ